MAVPSSKACKSQATSANSESMRLLHTFPVSCTAAFLDLLRSSVAKLAHLSLNCLIQFYLTLCVLIPSFRKITRPVRFEK